jgi:hypothetical protein
MTSFLPPEPSAPSVVLTLECLECGTRSTAEARGWRAYLYEEREVFVYCPDCAAREFGDE